MERMGTYLLLSSRYKLPLSVPYRNPDRCPPALCSLRYALHEYSLVDIETLGYAKVQGMTERTQYLYFRWVEFWRTRPVTDWSEPPVDVLYSQGRVQGVKVREEECGDQLRFWSCV